MPSLKSINAQAGTRFKRWKELTDAVTLPWHPQVHRRFAEKDGLTPADFTWLDYPLNDDVRLALPWSQHMILGYHATMAPETPQVNQYVQADERDPAQQYRAVTFGRETWYELLVRGSALSRVKFQLVDMADHAVLHESAAGHIKGAVDGGMGEGPKARDALLWTRLTPGTTLQVRLEATPLFFAYVDPETGSGGTEYSTVNNGYLGGDMRVSPVYELTLTPHGLPEPPTLLLDGQPAPEPEAFRLRGPAEGEAFHEWLTREREAITAQDSWVTVENMAGQVGMDLERYLAIEAGTIEPEDWERSNIEDAIKGWQEFFSA